jgi:hypothetical protein
MMAEKDENLSKQSQPAHRESAGSPPRVTSVKSAMSDVQLVIIVRVSFSKS